MKTLDAIHARMTAHRWQSVPVPPALIDDCLTAAQLAPCHKHTWPWRFIVVGPHTRAQITRIALAKAGDVSEKKKDFIRTKVDAAGALIVAVQAMDADPARAREDYAACACAIQNICLVAADAGFESKWGSGSLTRVPEVVALMPLEEGEQIIGFIWIGRGLTACERIARPPLERVVRRLP
ncbi:MAG: nitroreductase [Bradymonadia bacterium]|jgi:nitroreductase